MVLASFSFAGINALYCPMLSELFPMNVRFSGVAFCYTFAYSIWGGFLPLIYLHFTELTKYFYLSIMLFLILFVMYFFLCPFISDGAQKELST